MKSPPLISVLLFGLLVTAAPLRAGFIQGPVRGTVVLADGAHAGDLVAYVHCIAQGIHGGHKADDSSRVITSGEAFSIPWVYRGLSPRNCHLRVFHPRYLGAHRKLSDDFSQQLGTVELENWEVFLNRGPTDPPVHPAYPWPALEIQQHLSNLLFYYIPAFSAGPERQALGIYVPELHALLSRIMAMGAFGSSPRLNRHTPMGTIRKIEDAVFYPGAQSKLFAAVKQNDAKRVTEVIQGGAYVDGWDDKGHTPLYHAALAGHTESAIALIQRGADVNLSPHPKRETALQTAMSKRHWKTAAALVANGASLDTGIHRTWLENAMCATSKSGDIESLRIFLDAGINPDITQTNGVTPLMCAANGNQPKTAKLLIRAGADVNARASHNRSALRYAQSGRFHEIAEILKNAGARE